MKGVRSRAGVSSFSIGGTNAHLVMEEAPDFLSSETLAKFHLLTLSAKTPIALQQMLKELADHVAQHPNLSGADIAYTRNTGRSCFPYRHTFVYQSNKDIVEAAKSYSTDRAIVPANSRTIAFMFTGQGVQYPNMAGSLYRDTPIFREQVELCANIIINLIDIDIRACLFPVDDSDFRIAEDSLQNTALAQLALFTIEYAMAKLWMSWGMYPNVLIGHSIGEYVAACLAGVFSLEIALKVIAERGKLMQSLPAGQMLSVSAGANEVSQVAELQYLLTNRVSVAADNSPCRCVLSGSLEDISRCEHVLTEKGFNASPLSTSHAFHSRMVEPVVASFAKFMSDIPLNSPAIPYISNVTGEPISEIEVKSPGYWAQHLRATVRFSKGIGSLLDSEINTFIEMGPGQVLGTLVRQNALAKHKKVLTIPSLTGKKDNSSDLCQLFDSVGRL